MFVKVALDLPVDRTFLYRVPSNLSAEVGKRVLVPFQEKELLRTGIVVSVEEKPDFPEEKIKNVVEVLDEFPLIPNKLLELAEVISVNYCSYLGETLFSILPSVFKVEESVYVRIPKSANLEDIDALKKGEKEIISHLIGKTGLKVSYLRRKAKISTFYQSINSLLSKGLIELFTRKKGRRNYKQIIETVSTSEEKQINTSFPVTLSSQQEEVKEKIKSSKKNVLLLGPPNSGKTEVCLNLCKEEVLKGNAVLILVPELLLTPELKKRIETYFGKDQVVVYHGKLSEKEKGIAWLKALLGKSKVFVGTRSAIFLPIKNLSLIVVDEEHDSSYKEQQKPYYNARDVAILRSGFENLKVILVSSTPSVETFYKAKLGKIELVELKERITSAPYPFVRIVELSKEKRVSIFSRKLLRAIENTVKKKEQVLVFINRRGFFSKVFCLNCGFVAKCENCAVPLVYHKTKKQLLCHVCGRNYKLILNCPKCGSPMSFRGYGTQRVEEELKILLPQARIVRIDQDTVKDPVKGAKLIEEIVNGKWDIIVGTQMAVKGHNFPKLTLVVVLLADLLGGYPDFYSNERIFQAVSHAVGMAGRLKPGASIVQVIERDNFAVKCGAYYQPEKFYEEEISTRKMLGYPPFSRCVLVELFINSFSGYKKLEEKVEKLREELSNYFSFSELTPSLVPKSGKKYRFFTLLRTSEEKFFEAILLLKEKISKKFSPEDYKVIVDPVRIG
jgi:primosomal protein N' (replication factor Y)